MADILKLDEALAHVVQWGGGGANVESSLSSLKRYPLHKIFTEGQQLCTFKNI